MRIALSVPSALVVVALALAVPSAAAAQSSAEIDRQVWQAVAKSVVDHDIAAMARVYHPAAVLASQKGSYGTIDKAGVGTPNYVRFEALLVKTDAGWQMVMERQLEAITEREWNALPR